MKYETKNHIGIGALMLGGALVCFAILFARGPILAVLLTVSLPMIIAGGYMMTRSFTQADVDHPDYEDYQRRVKAHEEAVEKRSQME